MKTVQETRKHNYQCFAEGVADIDANVPYMPAWETPVPGIPPLSTAISATGEDNAVFREQAGQLPALEVEALMSRMSPRLHRLVAKDAPSKMLALAIQLKKEDGDLYWWRQRIVEIREQAE